MFKFGPKQFFFFCALHAIAGIGFKAVPGFAFAHGLATIAFLIYVALTSKSSQWIAGAAAYAAGAEIIWRIAKTPLPWESGKYAVAAILMCGLLRIRRPKLPMLALLYFGAHIPSALITLMDGNLAKPHQLLSAMLAGPAALTIGACYFANTKLTSRQLAETLLIMLGPLVSVSAMVSFGMYAKGNIEFGTESNYATSGGFGPNQVSGVLGFAVFASFYGLLMPELPWKTRILCGIGVVGFAVQSALTFSRGGLAGAISAILPLLFFALRDRRMRQLLAPAAVGAAMLAIVLIPRLNDYTGGKLGVRFSETDTTGRSRLIQEDFDMFLRHPVFGIGIGLSPREHSRREPTHNEFSRLLAEHGIFGAIALGSLLTLAYSNFARTHTYRDRAAVTSMIAWSFAFIAAIAMRIVAPAFLIGLSCVRIETPRLAGPQFRPGRHVPPKNFQGRQSQYSHAKI